MQASVAGIDALSPRKRFTPSRLVPKTQGDTPTVYGIDPNYLSIGALRIIAGRFFTIEEAAHADPVCVLGEAARLNLFGLDDPIGRYVKVNEQWFLVIGLAGPQAVAQGDVAGVPAQLLAEQRRTQRIFEMVMVAIASISLLVGGIGIMNIMLASVLERTREIGVRRAIGARRADIVRQFVMETTLIAVAGGTVGLIVGASLSRAIASFAGWSTIISSGSLALAFSVSVLIGLVSGVYPAMKASRLDPVQALHYE